MKSEAAMCRAFIDVAVDKKVWDVYPETAGWDILLVHKKTGIQIGIEAKQSLNAKVLEQAISGIDHFARYGGPDYRAVLVPEGGMAGLDKICKAIGVTVIRFRGKPVDNQNKCVIEATKKRGKYYAEAFTPRLVNPEKNLFSEIGTTWFDWCPDQRCALPDYIPDVKAGVKSPVKLTDWKIKAIKIDIMLSRQGYITSSDFKEIGISMSRWIQSKWIKKKKGHRGMWVAGQNKPDFRSQHPLNYKQIGLDKSWQTRMQAGLF